MLVVTRRIGECLKIGDQVTVKILGRRSVDRNAVVLGIAAPKSIPVHREEIYERIHRESSGEASSPPPPERR